MIAAGGGDGTVSTVAAAVAGTNAALSVLPLGTLNHFARDVQIPRDIDEAIATMLAGRVVPVDVGEVNGRIFINNTSIGLYPRLVRDRGQQQPKGRRRSSALAAAAWTAWRRYRRVTVRIQRERGESTTVRTPFVFVGNNVYHLCGLDLGSRERVDAGRLHVCTAPETGVSGMVRGLGDVLVGQVPGVDRLDSCETTSLTVDGRTRLGVAIDGEFAILRTPLRYRIRPGALRVVVPSHGTGR